MNEQALWQRTADRRFRKIASVPMDVVYLVSCVGSKLDRPASAADLYTSPWFRKARAYVEQRGAEWFILSAKYGLVSPSTLLDPYEQTLTRMPVGDRREWAGAVVDGLRLHLDRAQRVVLFAGQRYREFVVPRLRSLGLDVSVPMEGLGIGQQLAWLDAHLLTGRAADLARFYEILSGLRDRLGGERLLADGRGPIPRPARGVYFFFESGENRSGSGSGPRVVRVGTHGLVSKSKSTLWSRLAQHRGKSKTPGGNHRGSIFRLLTGTALIRRDGLKFPSWGKGSSATQNERKEEQGLEALVSEALHAMPYLWLPIPDAPGPKSLRGFIERNAIALLSDFDRDPVDPPSDTWLGRLCDRKRVRRSGLWNQNHVDEQCDPSFLDVFEEFVGSCGNDRGEERGLQHRG